MREGWHGGNWPQINSWDVLIYDNSLPEVIQPRICWSNLSILLQNHKKNTDLIWNRSFDWKIFSPGGDLHSLIVSMALSVTLYLFRYISIINQAPKWNRIDFFLVKVFFLYFRGIWACCISFPSLNEFFYHYFKPKTTNGLDWQLNFKSNIK